MSDDEDDLEPDGYRSDEPRLRTRLILGAIVGTIVEVGWILVIISKARGT